MFAGVACTGGLAGDFKMRLQKRILNIQRSIQRCGGADRESVGGWCGGRRSAAGRSGELSTSASECDRAKRLSRSLSLSGGGSLLTQSSSLDLQGAAPLAGGEALTPLGKRASRKEASRRASSRTTRIFTFTRSGGKRSSVNEIQLGPEVAASAAGEGVDVDQVAAVGMPTQARVPYPDESAAPGPEPSKAWRTQFDRASCSSNILNIQGGGERKASYAPADSALDAQATLSGSKAEASELGEAEPEGGK